MGSPFEGKTRDVSNRGVYIVLDHAVSRSADVELNMVLPTGAAGGAGVFVRALGRIVRVEEWSQDRGRRVGVAAVIRRYEIVRNEPNFSPRSVSRGL
jgi:hypothetical protein